MQLTATDYGNFLANETPPISTSTIAERATQRMVDEFNYIRSNATGNLKKFLDYMTYAYMIDNIILLISGTLHERDTHDLLERCHPLGTFETMPALCVATNVDELYNTVLVETPLGESTASTNRFWIQGSETDRPTRLQHRTSGIACPRKISTSSTSRSFGTRSVSPPVSTGHQSCQD